MQRNKGETDRETDRDRNRQTESERKLSTNESHWQDTSEIISSSTKNKNYEVEDLITTAYVFSVISAKLKK